MSVRYVIVTPARDEERFLAQTVQSVAAQTIRPAEWVVVDDGSSDRTGEIADACAADYPWLHVVHRPDRGSRQSGGGVMEAFFDGFRSLKCTDWEFIVKLDGDLTFEPDYFERCFAHFGKNARLGIAGGAIWHYAGGVRRFEAHPRFHVRGATKIYRRACWEAIGGLWPGTGWDTIDEVHANMLGWATRTLPDAEAVHHRVTGSADGGWKDGAKNGRGNYISGYHPVWVLARALRRVFRKPYVTAGCGMLYGYASCYWKPTERVRNRDLIRYVRRQQMNRLLGRPTIWQ